MATLETITVNRRGIFWRRDGLWLLVNFLHCKYEEGVSFYSPHVDAAKRLAFEIGAITGRRVGPDVYRCWGVAGLDFATACSLVVDLGYALSPDTESMREIVAGAKAGAA